jgi:hypothetical protein
MDDNSDLLNHLRHLQTEVETAGTIEQLKVCLYDFQVITQQFSHTEVLKKRGLQLEDILLKKRQEQFRIELNKSINYMIYLLERNIEP